MPQEPHHYNYDILSTEIEQCAHIFLGDYHIEPMV